MKQQGLRPLKPYGKGATTYILYQYGSKYNQEKQYAVPLRAIVGKVSPEDPALMYPNDRIYISYDSTNKNSAAGDIDIVEFGKAKDDKGLPVFNLSIAMDRTNRVPLFYEEYPGSVTDVSQFTFMVDKAIEYGYKKIGFILDRGYFSKENIRYIDKNEYSFIIMCKGCKALVSSLVNTMAVLKPDGNLRSVPIKSTG